MRMKCSKKKVLLLLVTAAVLSVVAALCLLLLPAGRSAESTHPWSTKRCSGGDCLTAAGERQDPHRRSDRYTKPVREVCITKECLQERTTKKSGGLARSVCTSQECVIEAAKLLRWMEPRADPCEDFYNFSCGSFVRSHAVPDGWDDYGIEREADEEVALRIKNILERPSKVNESDALTRAKKLYASCTDLSGVEERSGGDLRDVLSGKGVGEWPLLHPDWQDCRLDLEWRMAKLNALGIDSLFALDVRFKGSNAEAFAYLSPAAPLVEGVCDGAPDNASVAVEERASEHRHILTSVLRELDVDITNLTDIDIDELFLFDFTFCNLTRNSKQEAEVPGRNHTLKDLVDVAPEINWIRWRNIIFSELRLNFPHDKLNIYVSGMESTVDDIIELLHNTSSKVLANYLTWKFVLHHLGFLGKPFQQIVENHRRVFRHQLGATFVDSDRWVPRWQQCAHYLQAMMPVALLPQYLPDVLGADVQREMAYVVPSMKNEFKDILRQSPVLKRDEKLKSTHKIDQVEVKLFYPEKEKKFYDKYYVEMGRLGDSFLKNGIKAKKSHSRRLLEGAFLNKSLYDLEYRVVLEPVFSTSVDGAFRANKIIISLGRLQAHRISSRLPRFTSMSTLGFTVGHQLTHGFDLASMKEKAGGKKVWPEYVLRHVDHKARCLVDQYSRAREESFSPNDTTVIDEAIADNQGVLLAYKGYTNYLMSNSEEKYLPGLHYTNEQLFFVRYAQMFCRLDAVHEDLPRVRVNEALKNFQPFAQYFQCTRDAPMNPTRKCDRLWA